MSGWGRFFYVALLFHASAGTKAIAAAAPWPNSSSPRFTYAPENPVD